MARISNIKDTDGVVHNLPTKVIRGILQYDVEDFMDDVLIPLDTVFEPGYDYILELYASGSGGSFYDETYMQFRLASMHRSIGDHTLVYYNFICTKTINHTMIKRTNMEDNFYQSMVTFVTDNGSPDSTATKDGVTYWKSYDTIRQAPSNAYLDYNKADLYSAAYLDTTGSYPRLKKYDEQTWISVGNPSGGQGLLPAVNGSKGNGHNSLGTSTWYWENIYVDKINGDTFPRIKYGTLVKTITATNPQRIWTKAEIATMFGESSLSLANVAAFVMNGDRAAQGTDVVGVSFNNSNTTSANGIWCRFSGTPAAGSYRFQYVFIRFS